MVLKEFGRRLSEVRKGKKLKQLALSRRLGLSRTSISNIERGEQRISLELAYHVAYVLEVSLQELLPTLEEVMPSKGIGRGVRVHTASDEVPLVHAAEEEALKLIEELRKRRGRGLSTDRTKKGIKS